MNTIHTCAVVASAVHGGVVLVLRANADPSVGEDVRNAQVKMS